eukprot:TRINITY_DN3687_c0_g1_i7.p1 TRINITY_DN3687_c0_g1~~TRINITY_DN3687_c0_g1_i7.p1  ORF type:complete len:224 (+),score=44.59 TRINITY_DN3687_c0_g1_i7:650-1321(+)
MFLLKIWMTPFLTSPTDAGFALLVRSHLSLVKSFVLREMNSHAKDNQLISKILNYFLLVSKELLELKNMFTLFGVIAGIQDFLSTNLEATSLLSAEDFAWLEMTSDNFVHQQEITPFSTSQPVLPNLLYIISGILKLNNVYGPPLGCNGMISIPRMKGLTYFVNIVLSAKKEVPTFPIIPEINKYIFTKNLNKPKPLPVDHITSPQHLSTDKSSPRVLKSLLL